jgi:uncharacterized membrane protein YuzA (DUF378 family)
MKALNIITLLLVIVGGLNWGAVALTGDDIVGSIFGGMETGGARAVYGLVAISALWQLVPFFKAMKTNEVSAEANTRGVHMSR